MDFTTIEYLKNGSSIQQEVYAVLVKSTIFSDLNEFDPVLVGTFPIGINIESSDLDIACCWQDKNTFVNKLNELFSNYDDFSLKEFEINGSPTILANFRLLGFEFEIFGQNIPVYSQFGYRHMILEAKLLEEKGDEFKQKIIALKNQGYKTEPAFAILLGLSGDPYLELLKFE